jgi:hypothetical protein
MVALDRLLHGAPAVNHGLDVDRIGQRRWIIQPDDLGIPHATSYIVANDAHLARPSWLSRAPGYDDVEPIGAGEIASAIAALSRGRGRQEEG